MRTGQKATAVGLVDVAVLVLLAPHPGALIAGLTAPHAWVGRVGADAALAALAGAALWLTALWLAIGLAAAAAARLPGVIGRCSARIGGVLLPRALRSLVAGSAGLGVLLTPVTALAELGSTGAVAADAMPAPAWPIDPGITAAAPATTLPTPVRAVAPATDPAAKSVTVRPGDSLWLIAGRNLGPRATDAQVAAAWPRWFAANRSVIGADPAVLHPGQVLVPPSPVPAEEARP